METRALKALIFPFHFIRSPNSLLKHTWCSQGCFAAHIQLCCASPWWGCVQNRLRLMQTEAHEIPPALPLMPQSRSFSSLLVLLSKSSGIPLTHLGLMWAHSVHPSVVRAVGDNNVTGGTERPTWRASCAPNLSHPPHTHTMSQVSPRPSLAQVAAQLHSRCPCSTAASASDTS